ncbi:MAG: YqgE/AlgH family protein [Candidatus Puniceispirillales bacterium]
MAHFLTGQFLIAMPQMDDPRFSNTVIFICSHDEDAAMGVVINQAMEDLYLDSLAEQIGIGTPRFWGDTPVFNGGPMEQSRGLVIHSSDHMLPDSITINDRMAMTSNIKIINEIANGYGPQDFIVALGHASWTSGQLEREIRNNVWLTLPFQQDLIFNDRIDQTWMNCFSRLGISTSQMSPYYGHA